MRQARLSVRLAIALACGLCGQPTAGTIFVDDDNCPGPGSGTAGDPFCSIQDAIDAATSGADDVEVAPASP